MAIANIKQKPDWAERSKELDFKIVNEPLEETFKVVSLKLKKDTSGSGSFIFLLRSLLDANFQTYRAIRKLVAKKPKFPVQAYQLTRFMIDSVFVVFALIEEPDKNTRWYELAGYRTAWEEYKRELGRYSKTIKWQGYLANKKRLLDYSANFLKLPPKEQLAPDKNIEYWPIPSQLLRKKMLSTNKQKFLEEIYQWRYKQLSEWSHGQWGGVAVSVFASKPELHWDPGKFESDAVYTGLLFLLVFLSEIEVFKKQGVGQKLKYIWMVLGSYFDEAKDYYDLRYAKRLI